jgi:hypothetical protein
MIFMMAISTNHGMKQTANTGSAEPKLERESELEHWTRLNYGVVATKVRTVCLVEDYVTHTVHADSVANSSRVEYNVRKYDNAM